LGEAIENNRGRLVVAGFDPAVNVTVKKERCKYDYLQ
jgi:hypothetical protein